MIIKVQCLCGTRFQFEVMPVNGRMPVPVHCPTCNADDTELANALIQQQSSTTPSTASAPTPAAPASGLRVAGLHKAHPQSSAPAAPPTSATPALETATGEEAPLCPKHKTETAIDACKICGKPICLKCMEQFGYVCGVYCRQQATAKRIYIPPCPHQKSVIEGKAHAKVKWIATGIITVAVLMLGFWIWYVWFAREPKIVYSLPIPKPNPDNPRSFSRPPEYYRLIGPGQLLAIKDKQVSMFDVTEQHQLWSSPMVNGGDKESGDDYFGEPRIAATSNDVWIAFSDRLARFDRQTGSAKAVGISNNILKITMGSDAIIVLAGSPEHEILNRISLSDGALQTEENVTPAPLEAKLGNPSKPAIASTPAKKPDAGNSAKVNQIPIGKLNALAAQAQPVRTNEPDAQTEEALFFEGEREPFILAGRNVVELKTHLLEHKTVAHNAMKPKGKSLLDNSNLNASQGVELAQEMMNDARREETGGVEIEDLSRYQVTLHRCFEKDVPDWSGEVSGPPQFFALNTIDVLFSGQDMRVFDKYNKKLWEAKLTFPVMKQLSEDHPPCLETKDALYVADAGTLTRFDLNTGSVRWRYNTVGISRIAADERGGIYVVTTTAGPEQIRYSQQVNLQNKIKPVVMKFDAEKGKVLWRQEAIGDEIMFSGKYLYATRVSFTYALLHLEDGPDTHYNLNLLSPASGSVIWNFHQGNRRVLRTEVQKNWILLHMEDQVLVLKFFSL